MTCGARQHTPCYARFKGCASCKTADQWAAVPNRPEAKEVPVPAGFELGEPVAAAASAEPEYDLSPPPSYADLDPESPAGKERAELLAAAKTASDEAYGVHAHSSEEHYKKIWAVLCVLLVISVVGPMLEIMWVTLITAFGIAFVKAYLVVKEFMHVNIEKPVIRYAMVIALGFMVLFFAGTAPDIKKHEGLNWDHVSAKEHIKRVTAEQEAAGEHGDGEHGATEAGAH
jgi:caa(3)-type oxidase subunit IV